MRIPLYLLLLTVFYSCSENRTNFTVEVSVDGGSSMLYLAKRTINNTFVVDSAMPGKSGIYSLKGFADQPDFYVLYQSPRNYINLIIHPGDDFKILTKSKEFDRNYLVEGSKDSRLIQKLVTAQIRTLEKITELSDRYEAIKGSPDFLTQKSDIDSSYDRVFEDHRKFSLELINNNPESLAGLMALYQQLGRNQPVFDYHKDFAVYEKVDSSLAARYPDSEAVIDLNRKVTELRDVLKLEKGSQAPDIILPNAEGSTVKLSSLRGKRALLIFWASWSTMSVNELKEFQSLYGASAAKNVEFYVVSLDRTRESWLQSLDERGEQGIHVSDLKYWDSPVVDLYNIEKLPFAYLLDEKGTIIQKGFNPREYSMMLDKF